jgi:hypothetical protein
MKKILAFFTIILIAATAHSQSLTEKDIKGTWQVLSVENAASNPSLETEMYAAQFNFYADHSFALKIKKDTTPAPKYDTTSSKNANWNYNPSTQTISIPKEKMTLKVDKSNGQVRFVDQKTGVTYIVSKPI